MNPYQRNYLNKSNQFNQSGLSKYQSGNSVSQLKKSQSNSFNNYSNSPFQQVSQFNPQQLLKKKQSSDFLSKYSTQRRQIKYSSSQSYGLQKSQNLNINKNINTNKKKVQIAKIQYKKFISDTENIFYENRTQAKYISLIQKILQYIVPIYLVLLITAILLIKYVTPIENCPPNAECGVYIYCDNGFILNEKQMCQTDPLLKMEAQSLIQVISENLQYKYGNQECVSNSNQVIRPQITLSTIKQDYSITLRALQEEIIRKLTNAQNQQKYGFYFDNSNMILIPTIKQFSFNCRMQKKFSQPIFLFVIGIFFAFMIGVTYIVQNIRRHYLGKEIYQKLKAQCHYQKTIIVKEKLMQIEKKSVSQKLWLIIDRQRRKQEKIMYYQDKEHLYWRWIIQ